jgi:hypothetical protein
MAERTPAFRDEDLLEALRAAATALGAPPTRAAYLAWREHEARRLRPSPSLIARRLGSWTEGLARAGLVPSGTTRRRRSAATTPRSTVRNHRPRRVEFSDEDLRQALRTVARAVGVAAPTRATYERHRASRPRHELPSALTIEHRLGRWPGACASAGLVNIPPAEATADAAAAIRALRIFAAARPTAVPTRDRYDAFRGATGATLPDAPAVTRACGTWRDALRRAGVDRDRRRTARLVGALIAAAALDGGETPGVDRYRALAAADPRWPSYRTFYREFGSWPAAVRAAGLA